MVQHPDYPIEFKPALASADYDQTYDLIFTQHLPRGLFHLWAYCRLPCFEFLLVDRFAPLDGKWADNWSTQFYLFLTTFNFCPFNEIPNVNQGNPMFWRSNELDNPDINDYPPLPPLSFSNRFNIFQDYFVTLPAGKSRLSFLNFEGNANVFFVSNEYNPVGSRVLNRVQIDFDFSTETEIRLNDYLFEINREDSNSRGFVANSLVFERFETGSNPEWVVFEPEGINNDFFLYSDISSYFNYVKGKVTEYIDDNSSEQLRLSPSGDRAYASSNCLPLGHYIKSKSLNFRMEVRPINFSTHFPIPQQITTQPFPSHYRNHHGLIFANNNKWGGEVKSDFGVTPVPTPEGVRYQLGLLLENYVRAIGQEDLSKRDRLNDGTLDHYSGSHDCDPNVSYDFGFKLRDYSNFSEFQERMLDDIGENAEPSWIQIVRDNWCDLFGDYYRYPFTGSNSRIYLSLTAYERERSNSSWTLSTYYSGYWEDSRGSFYKLSELNSLVLNQAVMGVNAVNQLEIYRYYKIKFYFGAWHEIPTMEFEEVQTTNEFKRLNNVVEIDTEDYSDINEVVTLDRTVFNASDLETSFRNDEISDSDYIPILQTLIEERLDQLVDSLRVKEIHATLNANKWAYAENDVDISGQSLGDKLDLLCKAMGVAFNRDGEIISIRQRKNIEYDGDEVTIPDGWTRGQFALNTGGSDEGQEGGIVGEQLLGMAYQNRANRYGEESLCADTQVEINDPNNALKKGDVVLCENLPQFLEAMLDDLDKALNLQEMGVAIIPNADNTGKYCRAEGLGTLLADVAWSISHLSKNIIQTHMISLKNEAMMHELFKSLGVPITIGNLPVQMGNKGRKEERTFSIPYPTFSADSPSLLQMQMTILSNIAPLLANCTDIIEGEQT